MNQDRIAHAGERHIITRIERPCPDSYAVIHYGPFAFPCSQAWFEAEKPAVGKVIVLRDNHWHVEELLQEGGEVIMWMGVGRGFSRG